MIISKICVPPPESLLGVVSSRSLPNLIEAMTSREVFSLVAQMSMIVSFPVFCESLMISSCSCSDFFAPVFEIASLSSPTFDSAPKFFL